jgi:hypothetical protein
MSIYVDHLRHSKDRFSSAGSAFLEKYDRGEVNDKTIERLDSLWNRRQQLTREMWIVGSIILALPVIFLLLFLS